MRLYASIVFNRRLEDVQNPNAKHLSGSADLRTDETKLVRIARKLSRQAQSAESETFRAWSKSKTAGASRGWSAFAKKTKFFEAKHGITV